jgi:hypothetical protein
MAFPALRPTGRQFNAGNWPVKAFSSQSGAEVRILYGSKRTGMSLSLSYDNISDTEAKQFLDHYDEVFGTFQTFTLPPEYATGWGANSQAIDAVSGNRWRYNNEPQVSQVRPGISSVTVELLGVL